MKQRRILRGLVVMTVALAVMFFVFLFNSMTPLSRWWEDGNITQANYWIHLAKGLWPPLIVALGFLGFLLSRKRK